jgi:cyclase
MVQRVADAIGIPFTVGGGLRTLEIFMHPERLQTSFSEYAGGGQLTWCVKSAERFGGQCIVVAIDAQTRNGSARSARRPESHGPRYRGVGCPCRRAWCREILLTSMDSDGTKVTT